MGLWENFPLLFLAHAEQADALAGAVAGAVAGRGIDQKPIEFISTQSIIKKFGPSAVYVVPPAKERGGRGGTSADLICRLNRI